MWGTARRGTALAAACAAALLSCALAPVAGAETKLSYMVPVTQPDELGQPVSIDTDVWIPSGKRPAGGWPMVLFFHGGGGSKASSFDAGHAAVYARHGYVTALYSARGHGESGGQTSVTGPKEMRDTFDVLAWMTGAGGRNQPAHPNWHINRRKLGFSGYSQGGLNTNNGQVYSYDRSLNPYGFRPKVITPGNTPDIVFDALLPHDVVKLSYGAGLIATYAPQNARISPAVAKWITTATLDRPEIYGTTGKCDSAGHDTPTSTLKQDLAARSPGCQIGKMAAPALWKQSFDDGLFTPEMGISMWRRMPDRRDNRLYLGMGGHGAPTAQAVEEADVLRAQLNYTDHFLRGKRLRGPRVTYWTRDPAVEVPSDSYVYPAGAWRRHTAQSWPPEGTRTATWQLGANGAAVGSGAPAGTLPLAPVSEDESNDPVAQAALSGTPLGTSPVPRQIPATNLPGFIAGFQTAALGADRELDGSPRVKVTWTPALPDTQLVLKVFDRAPDGTLALLSRGVMGMRGATPGSAKNVTIEGNAFSALVRKGHSLLTWVMPGDAAYYKPYLPPGPGALDVGPQATLSVPLRKP